MVLDDLAAGVYAALPGPAGATTAQAATRPAAQAAQANLADAPAAAGEIVAHLFASTSGSDSDWIVKLIDVYPDEYPPQPELGGYQLGIASDPTSCDPSTYSEAAVPIDRIRCVQAGADGFFAKPMDVDEAIMQLDLSNSEFLVFTNSRSHRLNVLYRRQDGNYGLIVPQS